MQGFNFFTVRTILTFIFVATLMFATGCKKETVLIDQTVVDNYIYDVGGQAIYQSNLEKNKQKTNLQFISILYQNVFRQSIPGGALTNLNQVRTAIGDKGMADQLITNAFINDNLSQIPTDAEMRADIDQFIEDTYLRFYLRFPSAYEKFYLKQEIQNDSGMTPELIYISFSSSNEYKFY